MDLKHRMRLRGLVWVGLGWSLNVGGVITRSKKHRDDLSDKGYYRFNYHDGRDDHDREPDIFYVNYSDFSGKFVIDYSSDPSHPYNIRFISIQDDNNIKVELISNQYFIITDKLGVKYEFKDTEVQNERMVSSGPYKRNDGVFDNVNYISSWFLSRIISPNGDKTEFKYKPGAVVTPTPVIDQIARTRNSFGYSVPRSCFTSVPDQFNTVITSTQYTIRVNTLILEQITFPSGKVVFETSNREDIASESGVPQKLSEVQLFAKTNTGYTLINEFNLSYEYFNPNSGSGNTLAKRLKLVNVSENGNKKGTIPPKEYTLEYNNIALPNKNTKDLDHWGYYVGNRENPTLFASPISKNPDPNYCKAGLLTSISYPTKGKTVFEWEPNDFSNLGMSLPWTSPNAENNGLLGPGVRVKSIKSYDNTNNSPLTTLYEYKTASGSSSGAIMTAVSHQERFEVLSLFSSIFADCSKYNGSQMKESGIIEYANTAIPLSGGAQGNEIGYSRVSIHKINGSEKITTIHEYYNEMLKTPFSYLRPGFPSTNNNLNGRLITESNLINLNGVIKPVKTKTYQYEVVNNGVVNGYIPVGANFENVYGLFPYYIQTDWIKTIVITEKEFTASGDSVTVLKKMAYNQSTKQKQWEMSFNSNNYSKVDFFRYAGDMVTLGYTNPYTEMVSRNMVGTVIETEKNVIGRTTDITTTSYQNIIVEDNNLIVPLNIKTSRLGATPEIRSNFIKYDVRGNVLLLNNEKNPLVSYIWGYNKQYPIAEIKNSAVDGMYHENFEQPIVYDSNISIDASHVHTGNYAGKISNSGGKEIISYGTSVPLTLTAVTKFTYSGWVYSDGPAAQIFLLMKRKGETQPYSYTDHVDTQEKDKWVYLQKEVTVPAEVTNISLKLSNNNTGNVWFDDLKFHPSSSQMTTLTYAPLVGITSSIAPSGKTIYYEYDSFQRLKNIKDQNGNIIKRNEYHFRP